MSRTDSLAAAIKADLLRTDRQHDTPECFVCGRPFTPKPMTGDDNTERFCYPRCREAFDNGAPRFDELPTAADYNGASLHNWACVAGSDPGYLPSQEMRQGRHGFVIKCAGCGAEFDCVNGLRCCSIECKCGLRRRKDTTELLTSVGMELPAKRKCESCGGDIPNWRGEGKARKRTRSDAKRCPKCR